MIASLPMYDRPETAAAHDALWAAIRDALRATGTPAPEHLDRSTATERVWRDPMLVLSQTCGLPYRAALHPIVQLVGTPDYGLRDHAPGWYSSVLVARPRLAGSDPRAWARARIAVNGADSQSGWAAPMALLEPHGPDFACVRMTGSHRASALAVAEDATDLAAIDAVSWRMMRQFDPFTAGLVVVARTPPAPGLPLITGPGGNPAQLRAVVSAAIAGLAPAMRRTLGLSGLAMIPAESYLEMTLPPAPEAVARRVVPAGE